MQDYTQSYSVLYRSEEKKKCYLCERGTEYQIGRHSIVRNVDTLKYLISMCGWCIRSFSIEYQNEPFKPEQTPKMGSTGLEPLVPENMDFDFT